MPQDRPTFGPQDFAAYLRGMGPPGESRARKILAIETVRSALRQHEGEVPDWLEELERQVEDGEL